MRIWYHLTHWPFFFRLGFWRRMVQNICRGWSDKDTWNLDYTIAEFALPRLRRFKEVTNGYPGELSEELWDEILDKMIFSLEYTVKEFRMEDEYTDLEFLKSQGEKVQEGLELFGKYFRDLWW